MRASRVHFLHELSHFAGDSQQRCDIDVIEGVIHRCSSLHCARMLRSSLDARIAHSRLHIWLSTAIHDPFARRNTAKSTHFAASTELTLAGYPKCCCPYLGMVVATTDVFSLARADRHLIDARVARAVHGDLDAGQADLFRMCAMKDGICPNRYIDVPANASTIIATTQRRNFDEACNSPEELVCPTRRGNSRVQSRRGRSDTIFGINAAQRQSRLFRTTRAKQT
jgi:hypothetical protein